MIHLVSPVMTTTPTMSKLPHEMDISLFTTTFANIYEHTPTIPSSAHASLTPSHTTAEALHALFSATFHALPRHEKHTILNAHPSLAASETTQNAAITPHSLTEQTSRGLLSLPADLRARFQMLNAQYEKTFGWPFIIPVKDFEVPQMLEQMLARLRNPPEEEFAIACACVDRIAQIRLEKWFVEHGLEVEEHVT